MKLSQPQISCDAPPYHHGKEIDVKKKNKFQILKLSPKKIKKKERQFPIDWELKIGSCMI
jgi:hypothetical protein